MKYSKAAAFLLFALATASSARGQLQETKTSSLRRNPLEEEHHQQQEEHLESNKVRKVANGNSSGMLSVKDDADDERMLPRPSDYHRSEQGRRRLIFFDATWGLVLAFLRWLGILGPEATPMPTTSPSTASSFSPTLAPVPSPSTAPTVGPTLAPIPATPGNTPMPTTSPSMAPSAGPTLAPSPSMAPSAGPTLAPIPATPGNTLMPTTNPSTAPSAGPTLAPIPTTLSDNMVSVRALSATTDLEADAETIASLLGGGATVLPDTIVFPKDYFARPLVALDFDLALEEGVDLASLVGSSDALRNQLVISLFNTDTTIDLATCASSCDSAQHDGDTVPPGYCYPPTDSCVCTAGFGGATCDDYCYAATTDTACAGLTGCAWCATTGTCLATADSIARTEDEVEECPACSDFTDQERFCVSAFSCSFCPSTGACTDNNNADAAVCPFDVTQTSPRNGEENVALTRETVINFSEAVDPASVSADSVQVMAQTGVLDTNLYLSSTGLTLTIFYTSYLPANADIAVRLTGDLASVMGGPLGSVYEFVFSTLSVLPASGTMVCGRVFASELSQDTEGEFLDVPLPGVTISVDGNEEIFAVTESDGTFVMTDVPAGTFFVHINGKTSPSVMGDAFYPNVGKSWTTVAGIMNQVGTIYLPLISGSALQVIDDTETTIIKFPQEVLDDDPSLEGVFLSVPPGSLVDSDASGDTPMVGIAPVDRDRLPGELPPTLRLPLVITIQTSGGSNFDVPVPVCFPNLPDPVTGTTPEPGDSTSLWSFNHDTGRFDVVGPATVSEDGTKVCSDPGYGIVAPGWHGAAPGTPTDPPPEEPECDEPCCDSGSGGGGGGGGEGGGGGWGSAAYSGYKALLRCAGSFIKNSGVKCARRGLMLANSLVDGFSPPDPGTQLGAQDVINRVGGFNQAKWNAIRDCAKAALKKNPVSLAIDAYKCTRDVVRALGDACDAAFGPGGGDCPDFMSDVVCDSLQTIDDVLFKNIDTVLSISSLLTGGIIGRHLEGLPSPGLTPDEEKAVLLELFFEDEEQYERFSVDFIDETINKILAATEDGLTDEEILALYGLLSSDMRAMRDMMETAVMLEDPVAELQSTVISLQNNITSVGAIVEEDKAAAAGTTVSKRQLFIYIETEDGDQFRIQTTEAGDIVGFVMAPQVSFAIVAYDAQSNAVGFANGETSPNGVRTTLPSITFTDASVFDDTDNDGLCDFCEFVVGTNAEMADSDLDGTGDLQEILRGSNPLNGLALTTGVVGNFPLPQGSNTPTALEAMGSKIFLGLASGGVACYNVFDALQPTLTNVIGSTFVFDKLSTRGDALLGLTSSGEIILLSGSGYTETTAVSDALFDGISVDPTAVYLGEEYALVGTRTSVFAFTSDFQFLAQDITAFSTTYGVNHLALTPFGALVVVSGPSCYLFLPDPSRRRPWEETPSAVSSVPYPATDLRVGNDRIYVASRSGSVTVLSASTGLSLGASSTRQPSSGFIPLDLNGDNVVTLANGQAQLWDWNDPSDPTFVAAFTLDGITGSGIVASANGLVYVGTTSSLSIVNVFQPDTAGSPPSIDEIKVSNQGADISESPEVEEFSVLRVIASVSDDILVRQVLFEAIGPDGKIRRTLDSSFPYSTTVAVPGLEIGGNSTLVLRTTAWDIAGNVAPLDTRSFEIVPDTTPPFVNIASPDDNSTVLLTATDDEQVGSDLPVAFFFSEPVVLASNPLDYFVLQMEGELINTTGMQLSFSATLNRLEFTIPKESLSFGILEIEVLDGLASDVRENPSGAAAWSLRLVSNDLFLDTPFICTPTAASSCLLRFRRPENVADWTPVSLAMYSNQPDVSEYYYVSVFKGSDNSYPEITSYSCYHQSNSYRSLFLTRAFVLEPFTQDYTIEISTEAAVAEEIRFVLSGVSELSLEVLVNEVSDSLSFSGQLARYRFPNDSQGREILVQKEGNVGVDFVSEFERDSFSISNSWEARLITLDFGTPYWVDVRSDTSGCWYYSPLSVPLNYTLKVRDTAVESFSSVVGEAIECTVADFGDYCDFSIEILQAEVGLPLSFYVGVQSQQAFNDPFRVEIWYDDQLEDAWACFGLSNVHSSADFRPDHAGSYTLRVREYIDYYARASFLGNFSLTIGPSILDATDLPVDTLVQNTWTHPSNVAWYRIVDVARGDVLAIEVSGFSPNGYARIEIFTSSGRRLQDTLYYENQAPSIRDFVLETEGPILIAYTPGSRFCEGNVDEWEGLVGLEHSIAVWKRPQKDLSTYLSTATFLSYGSSVDCVRDNVADFCQYKISVTSNQVGLPLSAVVYDTESPSTSIRPELQILERGEQVFFRRCYSGQEVWTQGEFIPQSEGDFEIRVNADFAGNFTLEIGEDPFQSFTPLNSFADREMNFTHVFNGTFAQLLIGYTLEANLGDLVSVNIDYDVCCPRAFLAYLPSGTIVQSRSYGFDNAEIPHTGRYGVYITKGNLGSCNSAGYKDSIANEDVTVTISKVSGVADGFTEPEPETFDGQVLDSIVKLTCAVNTTGFRSCAYNVSVSDDLAKVPLSLLLTHPEYENSYSSQVRVFREEDYPYEVLFDVSSCTTTGTRVAYWMGGFTLPHGGQYIVQLQAYGNQEVDLELDLFIGVGQQTSSALSDGDVIMGEINEQNSWAVIQVDVPEDESFVTIDLVEGLGRIYLFDPAGSFVDFDIDTLHTLVEHRGIYTGIVSAATSRSSTCAYTLTEYSNFTLTVATSPAYPELATLPTVALDTTFDCTVEITPFEKCTYKIEIGSAEVGIPYSIYPEVLSLGNHSSSRESRSYFQTEIRVMHREDYPIYTTFTENRCSSYAPCTASSCIDTGIVGEIIFDRTGTYILEVGNGYYYSRNRLTGHLALTMSPATVEVVDLTSGPTVLRGNLTDRQATVYSLENIAGDLLIDEPNSQFAVYLRLLWDSQVRSSFSFYSNIVLETDRTTDASIAIWQDSPSSCRAQETISWLSGQETSYSVRISNYEEFPDLPLPSISFGEEFNCTITTPAMYCAYEWEASDEHVHNVLPMYFDAPDATLGEGERWRSAVFIANIEQYPVSTSFSDSDSSTTRVWYGRWFTVPRPGKYIVRVGNYESSRQRGTGTVRVHWGKGNLQSFNDSVVPLNEEVFGVEPYAGSYPFEAKAGEFFAVEVRSHDDRNVLIFDCNGDAVYISDYSYDGTTYSRGFLFQTRTSGKHIVFVEPSSHSDFLGWESITADPYSVILHEANPEPPAADRFVLTQDGQLEFDCLAERAWSYCTFELDVTEDIVGNSLSVLVSNVRNITDRYELDSEWDIGVFVDQNDFENSLDSEYSYCADKTYRSEGFSPQAPGRYTVRIGNRNGIAHGAFEVSFSDIWKPQQAIALGETLSGTFNRWNDVHYFRVGIADANYRITVTVPDGMAATLVAWSVDSPFSRYQSYNEGTVVRNIYPSSEFVVAVSPRSVDNSCEDLDTIIGATVAYDFSITITANP